MKIQCFCLFKIIVNKIFLNVDQRNKQFEDIMMIFVKVNEHFTLFLTSLKTKDCRLICIYIYMCSI